MDLIWRHISPEPMRCPECINIGLTLWPIRRTSFWFGTHVWTIPTSDPLYPYLECSLSSSSCARSCLPPGTCWLPTWPSQTSSSPPSLLLSTLWTSPSNTGHSGLTWYEPSLITDKPKPNQKREKGIGPWLSLKSLSVRGKSTMAMFEKKSRTLWISLIYSDWCIHGSEHFQRKVLKVWVIPCPTYMVNLHVQKEH